MGNECCAASSNDTKEIVVENVDETIDEEPNELEKKEIDFKKNEENELKTTFYGTAGIVCSKTMISEKNSKIEFVIQDYRSKIVKNDKNLEKIKEESFEEENPRKETGIHMKSQNSISTNQIIDQEASHYLEDIFVKLEDG